MPPPSWSPPSEFDEYRLVAPLGHGAMGQVWRARDTALDREVAVKFLGARLPDGAAQARFLVEARAVARLAHPNVVTVHRAGAVGANPYIVTELLEGQSLDRLPMPVGERELVQVGLGLARGLAAAHRRGVLHRDVKPANAFLTHGGEVKLLDFGLAKLFEALKLSSASGSVAPSPAEFARAAHAPAVPEATPLGGADVTSPRASNRLTDRSETAFGETETGARGESTGGVLVARRECGPTRPPVAGSHRPSQQVRGTDRRSSSARRLALEDGPTGSTATAAGARAAEFPRGGAEVAPALTDAGALLGTPLYLAPELWRGEPATTRSDVYALGAVLYELASGVPPARSSSRDLALAEPALTTAPRPVAELAPHLQAALAALIDRCLKHDAELRFADAALVLAALEALLPASASQAPATDDNPYRGLLPWEAEHRAAFRGRDAEAREVLERLKADGAAIVAGASGSGKSSLCRAAILPAVREGGLGDGRTWSTAVVLPGRQPRAAFVASIARALGAPEAVPELARTLDAALGDGPLAFLRSVRSVLGPGRGLLVFVDQLEELATFADGTEAACMTAVLIELSRRVSGLALLATLRADFLARLGTLGPEAVRCLLLLGPIGPDALREVVVGPARAHGASFESEAMVDRLVAFGRTDGALPLLQFTLSRLWEARDVARRCCTEAALEALGGPDGALGRYAERALEALAPAQQAAARTALPALVGEEGTLLRCEAAAFTASEALALDALVRARLVVVRDGGAEGPTYELAHEALARAWPTLREWCSQSAAVHAMRRRLAAATSEWERLGRSSELLWTRRQLAELEVHAGADFSLPVAERRFLEASMRAARLRRLRWPALGLFAIAVGAGVWGGARTVAARRLAAQVDRRLEAALRADEAAAAARHAATQLATSAYAHYDGARWRDGERLWRRVDAAREAWAAAVARRLAECEAAFALSGESRVVERLADAVFAKAQLHEALGEPTARAEAALRLRALDPSGALVARLDAPAVLTVTKEPDDAAVELATVRWFEGRPQLSGFAPFAGVASPASPVPVAPGDLVLRFSHPRRPGALLPLRLAPGETRTVVVRLPESIPAGFVFVPPGRFLFGASGSDELRTTFFETAPQHAVDTPGYFIARTEVTFRQWLEFVRSLPRAERARWLPHNQSLGSYNGKQGLRVVEVGDRFRLEFEQGGVRSAALDGELMRYPARDRRAAQDWLDFPVSNVSATEGERYARWLRESGRTPGARLCTELEWERAARGADGRPFPHGERLEPDDANIDVTYGRRDAAFGPDAVGSHPASASPFGLDDALGNVGELVRSVAEPGAYVIRGGSWYTGQLAGRTVNRWHATADFRFVDTGLRLCADGPGRHVQ